MTPSKRSSPESLFSFWKNNKYFSLLISLLLLQYCVKSKEKKFEVTNFGGSLFPKYFPCCT